MSLVVASQPKIPTFGIFLSFIDENIFKNVIFDLGTATFRKIKEIEELRGGALSVRRTGNSED
jgi:hypothetical protein